MKLPTPRGEVSAQLTAMLRRAPGRGLGSERLQAAARHSTGADPLRDEDLQLSLALLYELHYRGFTDVDDRWEWDAAVLGVRALLEDRFEAAVRERVQGRPTGVAPAELPATLFAMAGDGRRPALASFLARRGTLEHYSEFLRHRSVYHLKEADPHTWVIPRLSGRPKAALVEVQADEYGGGRLERMHSTLFAAVMRELGLSERHGAYLDVVPATTLAVTNLISMFGLHRRLRAAAVGHLAAFEMTSSNPNRLYGNGLRRLGFGPAATRFFDEHVEADAVHEQIAAHDLAGGLAASEPDLVDDIAMGAAACLAVDTLAGEHLLSSWREGHSSLFGGGALRDGDAQTMGA